MHRPSLHEGSRFMLASMFNKGNLELCGGSFSPNRAKPQKLSVLRLNTWLCVLREISFVAAATISSPFKWHQTGGTLFQAYKWPSAQVFHLIHRPSQIRWQDKDAILQTIHNQFYSSLKWLASLISLRPDGFKSPLLPKTLSPTARHTSRLLAQDRALLGLSYEGLTHA